MSAAGAAPAIAKPQAPQTVVTAATRAPAPVPSKTEPYHIPASRPPLQTHSMSYRGDLKRHDLGLPGLPKLKRPPLVPIPKGNYFVLGFGIGVVIVTVFALRLFSHHAPVKQATVATTSVATEPAPPVQRAPQPPAKGKSQQRGAQKTPAASSTQVASKTPVSAPPSAPAAVKTFSDKPVSTAANMSVPSPSTDSTSAATVPPGVAAAAAGNVIPGEVLNQVLPDVSDKARSTIHGTVRVGVKVHVDPVGNVSSAELDSPGPSKFFADKALQAAKSWDFAPAKLDGHNVASDWVIKFHFTQSDTKVFPTEERP